MSPCVGSCRLVWDLGHGVCVGCGRTREEIAGWREMDPLEAVEASARAHIRLWDLRFTRVAREVASWSKDPACGVGAVVVSPDRRYFAVGYNGFPAGEPDDYEGLSDEERLGLTVHAEVNALLKGGRVTGWTLYSTKFPCLNPCGVAIVQAGIARVVTQRLGLDRDSRWLQSQARALDLFRRRGVTVTTYGDGRREG